MSTRVSLDPVKLQDGTLIRHKVAGYEGRIDGTTEIKSCFTERGTLLGNRVTKQTFQYRVLVAGEMLRRIAPLEDLEIVEEAAAAMCPSCQFTFRGKPGFPDKPGGRCQCGGWICPRCWACQDTSEKASSKGQSPCLNQRKRLVKRMAAKKKEIVA
jgi:hypothetical protein